MMDLNLTAAAPAASEPEMAENIPQTSTVAEPKPPLAKHVNASATSRNLRDNPVRTSTSPVRINNGTAVRAKASMPSKRLSPTSARGRSPDISSIAMAATPIAAQTGTAVAHRATNKITGR